MPPKKVTPQMSAPMPQAMREGPHGTFLAGVWSQVGASYRRELKKALPEGNLLARTPDALAAMGTSQDYAGALEKVFKNAQSGVDDVTRKSHLDALDSMPQAMREGPHGTFLAGVWSQVGPGHRMGLKTGFPEGNLLARTPDVLAAVGKSKNYFGALEKVFKNAQSGVEATVRQNELRDIPGISADTISADTYTFRYNPKNNEQAFLIPNALDAAPQEDAEKIPLGISNENPSGRALAERFLVTDATRKSYLDALGLMPQAMREGPHGTFLAGVWSQIGLSYRGELKTGFPEGNLLARTPDALLATGKGVNYIGTLEKVFKNAQSGVEATVRQNELRDIPGISADTLSADTYTFRHNPKNNEQAFLIPNTLDGTPQKGAKKIPLGISNENPSGRALADEFLVSDATRKSYLDALEPIPQEMRDGPHGTFLAEVWSQVGSQYRAELKTGFPEGNLLARTPDALAAAGEGKNYVATLDKVFKNAQSGVDDSIRKSYLDTLDPMPQAMREGPHGMFLRGGLVAGYPDVS